jgi:hypothetical protein
MHYLSLPYAYKRGQNINICAETENNAEQTAGRKTKVFHQLSLNVKNKTHNTKPRFNQ